MSSRLSLYGFLPSGLLPSGLLSLHFLSFDFCPLDFCPFDFLPPLVLSLRLFCHLDYLHFHIFKLFVFTKMCLTYSEHHCTLRRFLWDKKKDGPSISKTQGFCAKLRNKSRKLHFFSRKSRATGRDRKRNVTLFMRQHIIWLDAAWVNVLGFE